MARFSLGNQSVAALAVRLPDVRAAATDSQKSWWKRIGQLRQRLLTSTSVDCGVRLTVTTDRFDASILMVAPVAGENLLRAVADELEPLNRLLSGSVEFPTVPDEFDAVAQDFPAHLAQAVRVPGVAVGNVPIIGKFRLADCWETLARAAAASGATLAYQANLRLRQPKPEEIAALRKNFVRLSEHRIPEWLRNAESAAVEQYAGSRLLVDEYLGTDHPDVLDQAARMAERFYRQAHSGISANSNVPFHFDTSEDLGQFVSLGLHSSRVASLDPFQCASAAEGIDLLDRLILPQPPHRAASPLRIFVSYRRDDTELHVGRLVDRLLAHFDPDTLFYDRRSLPPGVDFRSMISSESGLADVLLVPIGRQWIQDRAGRRRLHEEIDYVRLEIEKGLSSKARVIPLLVDGTTMPHPDDLPESIRELAFRNAVPLRCDPDFNHDVERLVTALQALQSRPPRR
ncbi:MAG: toll/interleukin-1 receptor domain-containing protein [Planctomycetaceae bacterium]|nr:toll/interleukin-1 receptor domain-containing protein [Planctomycetaceae bacterium]